MFVIFVIFAWLYCVIVETFLTLRVTLYDVSVWQDCPDLRYPTWKPS